MRTLFDFTNADAAELWSPLNDVVMGGRSSSKVVHTDDHMRFEGEVSLENGGGFASMQADVELDLSAATGLTLRVRGDGNRYKLGLYDTRGRRRIAYRHAFDTVADEWSEVTVRFEDVQPRFRGRDVPDADPLNTAAIRGMSILIADKQDGPFGIDIAWIAADLA